MQSRRTFFQAVLGVVASVPVLVGSARARAASGGPPVSIRQWTEDLVLNGEEHRVHRIHMELRDPSERGLVPMFDIPEDRPRFDAPPKVVDVSRTRRIILPLFEFDAETSTVVGEEAYNPVTGEVLWGGPEGTPEARLAAVIQTVRESGFDIDGPGTIKRGHPLWITQMAPGWKYPKHAMGFFPYVVSLDDMITMAPVRMLDVAITGSGV